MSGASVVGTSSTSALVVPKPTHIQSGNTILRLSTNFHISIDGAGGAKDEVAKDLERAIQDTQTHLHKNRHRFLSVKRGREFFEQETSHPEVDSLVLSLTGKRASKSIAEGAVLPVEERPAAERYTLSVPTSGPCRIEADTPLGLFRGLATFQQLFYYHGDVHSTAKSNGFQYTPYAPCEIEDQPAFGWRAILLDTSRNFFTIPSILKMLDSMSLVKVSFAKGYQRYRLMTLSR